MNNTDSTITLESKVNGMPESEYKQTQLTLKSSKVKSTELATKKRKLETDTSTTDLAYINITNADETENAENNSLNAKPSKVCIIQNESKTNLEVTRTPKPKSKLKKVDKSSPLTSIQKYFKQVTPSGKDGAKQAENTVSEHHEETVSKTSEAVPKDSDETISKDSKETELKDPSEVEGSKAACENSDDVTPMEVDQPVTLKWTVESKSVPDAGQDGEKSELNMSLNDDVCTLNDSITENETSVNTTEINADIRTPSPRNSARKKLTPKQMKKLEEIEQRKQEKERQKLEREKKKQEEKEEKQRLKEEKEKKRLAEIEAKNEEKRQKEEERKAKENERKAKENERKAKEEEKKRQKEEERKQKEEERKQKEEEKRQKEEERKQKEEQKRQKEELERKAKAKTAAAFTNFFVHKHKGVQEKCTPEPTDGVTVTRFMPFEVKEHMKLAAVRRRTMSDDQLKTLDEYLESSKELGKNSLYLECLKSKDYKPGHSENTMPLSANEDDDDVIIVDDSLSAVDTVPVNEKPIRYRCKLLQFKENRRPAYWGTWRKRSKVVTGRTPFEHDGMFDYEIDSDEEWDDEPGESLHGSDDEEKEPEDDYEVDNDLFVPHGYLSDEEGQNDDISDSATSPTSNKLKLNILEKEFEEEMKQKTHKLKPRVFGCIWISNHVSKDGGENGVENLLLAFRAVWNECRTPFAIRTNEEELCTPQSTPSVKHKLKNEFPDSYIPDLIRLVHGNKRNNKFLAKEFNAYVLSKDPTMNLRLSCIKKKLKEFSVYVSVLGCWMVKEDVRKEHNLMDLSHLANSWTYMVVEDTEQPQNTAPPAAAQPPCTPTSAGNPKSNATSIAKFVKVVTAEEREKQLALLNESAEKKSQTASPALATVAEPKATITKFVKVLTSEEKEKQIAAPNEFNSEKKPITSGGAPSLGPANLVETKKSNALMKFLKTGKKQPNEGSDVATSQEQKMAEDNRANVSMSEKRIAVCSPTTPKRIKPTFIGSVAHGRNEKKAVQQTNYKDTASEKSVNILTPRRLETKTDNVPQAVAGTHMGEHKASAVNVLIPRRVKSVAVDGGSSGSTSTASKPVNILIPRKANVANKNRNAVSPKTTNDITDTSRASATMKPVNILIPRRAKNVVSANGSSTSSVPRTSEDVSDTGAN